MHSFCITSTPFLTVLHAAGRDLQQAGGLHCSEMSNTYNCFVGGKQAGSVCVNQCVNPRNPLYCTNCEDPRNLCAKVCFRHEANAAMLRPCHVPKRRATRAKSMQDTH